MNLWPTVFIPNIAIMSRSSIAFKNIFIKSVTEEYKDGKAHLEMMLCVFCCCCVSLWPNNPGKPYQVWEQGGSGKLAALLILPRRLWSWRKPWGMPRQTGNVLITNNVQWWSKYNQRVLRNGGSGDPWSRRWKYSRRIHSNKRKGSRWHRKGPFKEPWPGVTYGR